MTWSWEMRLRALYLLISSFLRLELSRGVLVNRTIDDQFGDLVTGVFPAYDGSSWKQGATCTGCLAQPDPSLAFQGTWHDATWTPGDPSEDIVTVSFTGSAVYVFIILANSIPFTTTLTGLSFTLDGELAGNFVHAPTTSTDYEYNVNAYANNHLANAQHTLVMQTAGNNATLVLFDYVIYSFDDEVTASSPPSSPSHSPTSSPSPSLSSSPIDPTSTTSNSIPTSTSTSGAPGDGKDTKTIVGVLVGGIVFVALAIVLFLYWHKRRRNTISVIQILPNDVVIGGRYLDRRSESSYGSEATSGTWLTSSVPTGAYSSVFSYYDRSSVVPSTQDLSSNMATYVHPTAETERSEGATSIHIPVSETHNKSAERQRDLSRRIEQIGLGAIPMTLPGADSGRELVVDSRPHGDIGEAEGLREQVVFLLDEVERLHAQQESIARSFGIDYEPPPDYSNGGRRSPFSQI